MVESTSTKTLVNIETTEKFLTANGISFNVSISINDSVLRL